MVCPKCKELVPVVDKTIQEHGECPVGGMRYVPSPPRFKAGLGGPEFEVMAAKPVSMACPDCKIDHKGTATLVRVNVPNPTVS